MTAPHFADQRRRPDGALRPMVGGLQPVPRDLALRMPVRQPQSLLQPAFHQLGEALPIDDRAVIAVKPRPVRSGLAHLRLELVFVNGDPKARISQQRAVSVLHRR